MLTDWHIILNPSSGSGRGRSSWKRVSEVFKRLGLEFTHEESDYPGHLDVLVKQAIAKGKRKLISYGGDGTLNAMVNAVMRQDLVATNEITVAHFPAGTGNDWGKTFQNPNDPQKWVEMIGRGVVFDHDIGKVNAYKGTDPIEHYFINIAGMAYDSIVVKKVDEARASRWRFLKKLLYQAVIVKEIFRYKAQKLNIDLDGEKMSDKYLDICIGISQFNGDGMRPCFDADPADGLLDLTTVSNMGVLEAIKELPGMKDGSFAKHPKVNFAQGKVFSIEHTEYPDLIETDGELIGHTPVIISVVPKAMRLVVNEQPVIGW